MGLKKKLKKLSKKAKKGLKKALPIAAGVVTAGLLPGVAGVATPLLGTSQILPGGSKKKKLAKSKKGGFLPYGPVQTVGSDDGPSFFERVGDFAQQVAGYAERGQAAVQAFQDPGGGSGYGPPIPEVQVSGDAPKSEMQKALPYLLIGGGVLLVVAIANRR